MERGDAPEHPGLEQVTAERFSLLLDAVVAVGTGLSLPDVLRTIVEGACELTAARYGALGVIGPDLQLSEFVTVGIDDEVRVRIGAEPRGHGILGLLLRDPRPLMLRDLTAHPASVGFPPHHPPMHSFLGVPVRVRDAVFGNLYLCEKQGAEEFTGIDQELVSALAIAAGVAIENATLYAEERRREEWLDASAEINRSLLGGAAVEEVLRDIAVHAGSIARADAVRVLMPDESGTALKVIATHGQGVEVVIGMAVPVAGTAAGQAFTEGVTQLVDDAIADPRVFLPAIGSPQPGAVVYVPLRGGDEVVGVLSVDNAKGGRGFDDLDVEVITSFARQAAIAIALTRSRVDRDRMRTLEDRERIGRNLHDTVVQRLFALGMLLQATLAGRPAETEVRIMKAIDEIDTTIKEIRTSIFTLAIPSPAGLRAELLGVVDDYAERSGFEPHVVFEGPVDTGVPPNVARQVVAVAREAISNASRHARAGRVEVSLAVGDAIVLRVRDDGVGIPAGEGRRSGLANLEARAVELGGSLDVESAPGAGTLVTWRVPLTSRDPEEHTTDG